MVGLTFEEASKIVPTSIKHNLALCNKGDYKGDWQAPDIASIFYGEGEGGVGVGHR